MNSVHHKKPASAPATPSPLAQSERPGSPEGPTAIYQYQPTKQAKRQSSVGHHGFSAARADSVLGRQKHLAPPNLGFAPKAGMVSILSPVYSVAGSDGETPVSPVLPMELQFQDFDGVQRVSAEYLSDPESSFSQNRTSSSCSSYEAAGRPTLEMTRGGPARWSFASNTSVPELLHSSKCRSNTAPQMGSIPQGFEPVRRKPVPCSIRERPMPTAVHPAFRNEPIQDTLVVSRSASSLDLRGGAQSDVTTRQRSASAIGGRSAGAMGQRSAYAMRQRSASAMGQRSASAMGYRNRAPTPSRFSRVVMPSGHHGVGQQEEATPWL